MIIGERLRVLREAKKITRGEMEKRTGLLRCYICRVENGYTVPAVETLAKFANALKIPMYRLFYDGNAPLNPGKLNLRRVHVWGRSGEEAIQERKLRGHLGSMSAEDRGLLLFLAQQLAEGDGPRMKAERRGIASHS